MWRLAFLVVCHGKADIGQPVKGQFPIGLRIVNRRMISGFSGGLRIGFAMFDRAKQAKFEDGLEPHIKAAQGQSAQRSKARGERGHIAHNLKIFTDRTRTQSRVIALEHIARTPRADRGKSRLCRRHARMHRIVIAFNTRQVHQPDRTAQHRAPREGRLRHRLKSPFGDRARAIGHPLAAL